MAASASGFVRAAGSSPETTMLKVLVPLKFSRMKRSATRISESRWKYSIIELSTTIRVRPKIDTATITRLRKMMRGLRPEKYP